jgi:hypothetical protein
MQTFLPYADFRQSARSLDRLRLGKQRVENLQIMKALADPNYGWQNHPAVQMWRGCEATLMEYQRAICEEWTGRGYKDTCLDKTQAIVETLPNPGRGSPELLSNQQFHRSHRSNLVRKDAEFYAARFPNTPADLPYIWSRSELV